MSPSIPPESAEDALCAAGSKNIIDNCPMVRAKKLDIGAGWSSTRWNCEQVHVSVTV